MEMLLSVENKYLMAFITVNIAKKTFEYKTMETWPEERIYSKLYTDGGESKGKTCK